MLNRNRLVAQNIIKTPLNTDTYFTINKKLLAYSQQKCLKIKGINKEIQDSQILLDNQQNVNFFKFSTHNPWLFVVTKDHSFIIYHIEGVNCQQITKVLKIDQISSFQQSKDAVILDCTDDYYRIISFQTINELISSKKTQISISKLQALQKKSKQSRIISAPQCSNVYINTTMFANEDSSTQFQDSYPLSIYELNRKTNKYQKSLTLNYINNHILGIYKDRYIYQLSLNQQVFKQIQIFDIDDSKQIGKITVQGQFKYARIKQNLLIVVTNKQTNDLYSCFVLNSSISQTSSSIITHKVQYQKSKGDFYDFFNCKNQQALSINDKKKQIIDDLVPQTVTSSTSSVIYVLNKQKQKVEVIRLQHSKILQSPFVQCKVEKKILNSTIQNKVSQQKLQVERTRVKSSLEHKASGRNLEETQKKFVEALIDTKIKHMLKKFEQLQQRVQKLQKTIKAIYEKIDQNMKNINKTEVKQSVQTLFKQLTPQFQKYFGQLFKQVSGVLDQGVTFYNKKLATQAEIHKQALNEIVVKTFQSTKDIIELSKKEEKLSERTQKHLGDLLESRKEWQKRTDDFDKRSNRQVCFTSKTPEAAESGTKKFIRTDLNAFGRKET